MKDAADTLVKTIHRKTGQTYSAEEKIRIVLTGLRGERKARRADLTVPVQARALLGDLQIIETRTRWLHLLAMEEGRGSARYRKGLNWQSLNVMLQAA